MSTFPKLVLLRATFFEPMLLGHGRFEGLRGDKLPWFESLLGDRLISFLTFDRAEWSSAVEMSTALPSIGSLTTYPLTTVPIGWRSDTPKLVNKLPNPTRIRLSALTELGAIKISIPTINPSWLATFSLVSPGSKGEISTVLAKLWLVCLAGTKLLLFMSMWGRCKSSCPFNCCNLVTAFLSIAGSNADIGTSFPADAFKDSSANLLLVVSPLIPILISLVWERMSSGNVRMEASASASSTWHNGSFCWEYNFSSLFINSKSSDESLLLNFVSDETVPNLSLFNIFDSNSELHDCCFSLALLIESDGKSKLSPDCFSTSIPSKQLRLRTKVGTGSHPFNW